MDKKNKQSKLLVEQMVRNDDIFCSLLYDEGNSTLRVVDFRGGNFQQKQDYLKRIQAAEGFRKIFTLIERDDMQGWQRCGYVREGSIPGYYRRSDAYIMGWLADDDWSPEEMEEESEERKEHLNQIRELAQEYETYKGTGFRAENITQEEIPELVDVERERVASKSKSTKKAKKATLEVPSADEPLIMQFSRGVEYYYFSVQNKRTKQSNLFACEYQDCFGNAKIDLYFDTLKNKTDIALARFGLVSFVDWLAEIGTVAIFALVDVDNLEMNAVYASAGFKNSGWLHQQVGSGKKAKDQILWTTKLLV
ncbi:MAG: hypothetical protein JXX29_09770 [Deltaproteobacteria bacterium]|nr:hypothetical protein [Deltaproteobacteria bacterium]MBN2671953.1 hypothetical protein [Deltaproteobacteria bacterium]